MPMKKIAKRTQSRCENPGDRDTQKADEPAAAPNQSCLRSQIPAHAAGPCRGLRGHRFLRSHGPPERKITANT
jgi:hypothetical protein